MSAHDSSAGEIVAFAADGTVEAGVADVIAVATVQAERG